MLYNFWAYPDTMRLRLSQVGSPRPLLQAQAANICFLGVLFGQLCVSCLQLLHNLLQWGQGAWPGALSQTSYAAPSSCACSCKLGPTCMPAQILVLPPYRDVGLGKAMLQASYAMARDKGCVDLTVGA